MEPEAPMRPNTNPASADRLRAYAQQLREMAHEAMEAVSRDSLLKLAGEFEVMARERETPQPEGKRAQAR
jgi:hypothetical protein